MSLQSSEASLSRFPVVSTRDPAVMRETLLTYYGATAFDVDRPNDFFAESYHAKLDQASVGLCAYGTPTTIEFPECDFVRLQVAINGSAATTVNGKTTNISATESCVTPSDQINRIDFGSDFKQLFLRVDKRAIERKLGALLGAIPSRPVEFVPLVRSSQKHFDSFKSLIAFATRLVADPHDQPRLMIKEVEQALIVAFLETVPHSHSAILKEISTPTHVMSSHVRRVEEYIEAHWSEPLSVEDLARTSGVGARSIYLAFKRFRGYTPSAFIKSVRLRNAQLLLRQPSESTTVTNVAYKCGFANLGHFSKDYLDYFGESPSVTLARARQ